MDLLHSLKISLKSSKYPLLIALEFVAGAFGSPLRSLLLKLISPDIVPPLFAKTLSERIPYSLQILKMSHSLNSKLYYYSCLNYRPFQFNQNY